MGFLLTLLLAMVFGSLGLMRPRVGFYILLALIVFFEELGPGFTTFRGSWVFNAFFVGFYGLRMIEVLTVSMYIPFLLTLKPLADRSQPFALERALVVIFIIWNILLTALEYAVSKQFDVSSWRLLFTGMMQFHLMVRLFRSEDERMRLLKVVLVMLAIRAAIGLGMYAAGYGVHSPRGRLPFFYDSKQIEAFGLGAVILWSFILNAGAVKKENRPFAMFFVVIMFSVLLMAVGGSIRRTIWVTTVFGMLLVLVMSRRTTVLHYFGVLVATAVTVAGLLLAPGLEEFRSHMGKYVASLNLLDEYQFSRNEENDVHVNNVESYSRMLLENPDLILVGVHGPSGKNYRELMASYSEGGYRLGMAHNGPIRSMLSFGFVGLFSYMALFVVIIRRTYTVFAAREDDNMFNHAAVACGMVLFLDFAASMTFIPPFYTTSKGLFYTFFAFFILGTAAFRVRKSQASDRASRLRRPEMILNTNRAAIDRPE